MQCALSSSQRLWAHLPRPAACTVRVVGPAPRTVLCPAGAQGNADTHTTLLLTPVGGQKDGPSHSSCVAMAPLSQGNGPRSGTSGGGWRCSGGWGAPPELRLWSPWLHTGTEICPSTATVPCSSRPGFDTAPADALASPRPPPWVLICMLRTRRASAQPPGAALPSPRLTGTLLGSCCLGPGHRDLRLPHLCHSPGFWSTLELSAAQEMCRYIKQLRFTWTETDVVAEPYVCSLLHCRS